jgi:hypothetical protein
MLLADLRGLRGLGLRGLSLRGIRTPDFDLPAWSRRTLAWAAGLSHRPNSKVAELADQEIVEQPAEPTTAKPAAQMVWSPERIATAERLWGEGFIFPGAAAETLRWAKPLGVTSSATLLLLGAGAGGPAITLASELGSWVSGFEAEASLRAVAEQRCARAGLGKRATVEEWNPESPEFRHHYYPYALAIEPLRGWRPEPVLGAMALAVKKGGQLMLLELVADTPLDPADSTAVAWARLERRPLSLPSEAMITRLLTRLGFEVRVVEDVSRRHMQLAVLGWKAALQQMKEQKPLPREAALFVAAAEQWFTRAKLMREKQLRLLRWHAIGRPPVPE